MIRSELNLNTCTWWLPDIFVSLPKKKMWQSDGQMQPDNFQAWHLKKNTYKNRTNKPTVKRRKKYKYRRQKWSKQRKVAEVAEEKPQNQMSKQIKKNTHWPWVQSSLENVWGVEAVWPGSGSLGPLSCLVLMTEPAMCWCRCCASLMSAYITSRPISLLVF